VDITLKEEFVMGKSSIMLLSDTVSCRQLAMVNTENWHFDS